MKLGLSVLWPVGFAILVVACVGGNSALTNTPQSQKLMLEGDWQFFPNRLLTPRQIDTASNNRLVHVPASWTQYGQPSLGTATFRKKLKLPTALRHASIHFPSIHAASKIFLNGVAVDSAGDLGVHGQYNAKIRAATISLPDVDSLDIVVMVANYTTLQGGILKMPYIQDTTALVRALNVRNGVQNCIIGILLCMFMYQSILFFFYREGTSYLILGVVCLLVAVRSALVTGESQLLSESIGGINSALWFKLGFLTVFVTLFLLPLYIRLLFRASAPKWPLYIYVVVTIFLCTLVIFTPHYEYARYLDVYHIGMVTAFFYSVYSVYGGWRKGNDEARLILWGVVISFPFILVEMLQNSLLIRLGTGIPFLTELGLLVFLQFQVILLSNRYALSYRALRAVNQNLEFIIADRTVELVNANKVKDRLLSIMSHDIKNPLNSLKTIIEMFRSKALSQAEFENMLDMLETELGKTGMLVENILSWSAEQLKGVSIKKEKFDVLRLLELNIQLFHSALEKKHILVCHNLLSGLEIETDKSILNTVVRNLLANAIKFTPPSGKITIQVSAEANHLCLEIWDTGIGMDEKTLRALMDPKTTLPGVGTNNETGTGLGILLCRELIQRLNGNLKIESQVNLGSKFMVTIPLVSEGQRNFS